MEIKLIRDFETVRNKEQEDSFESTFNIPLFFDTNIEISKIDGWKISNIKKLIKSFDDDTKINIFFSKWNKNIEIIYSYKGIELIENKNFLPAEMDILKSKKLLEISRFIINSDKNKKYEIALFLISKINTTKEIILLSNMIINDGILNFDILLDILLIKYF